MSFDWPTAPEANAIRLLSGDQMAPSFAWSGLNVRRDGTLARARLRSHKSPKRGGAAIVVTSAMASGDSATAVYSLAALTVPRRFPVRSNHVRRAIPVVLPPFR